LSLLNEPLQKHLTEAPIDRFARASHPGMAHFAGTGPQGKTCRECVFWAHGPHDYRAKNGKYRGLIEPAKCNKYQQITTQAGAKVPDEAMSCRYFEQNEAPPLRFAKA
jgi:hypothetical protein